MYSTKGSKGTQNADSTVSNCLYHGSRWRHEFQYVMNCLHGKHIPKEMVKPAARTICSCKGGPGSDIAEKYLHTWALSDGTIPMESVQLVFTGDAAAKNSIQRFLYRVTKSGQLDNLQSLANFMSVLTGISEGNLESLLPPKTPKNQIRFGLPAQISYMPLIIGKNGRHIKRVNKLYKCHVELRPPKREQHQYLTAVADGKAKNKILAIVTAKEQIVLGKVKEFLVNQAAELVKKRQHHENEVKQYHIKCHQYRRKMTKKIGKDFGDTPKDTKDGEEDGWTVVRRGKRR